MSDWAHPALDIPASDEAAAVLQIRLFGPMEVRIGPHPLPRLRTRKGLWLLALLALRAGRHVERSWLAGTLWPEDDEAHARRSLRQSLHDLRLALGPEAWRLAGESPATLRLDVCGAFVDALAFEGAIARGDLDSLETAVRLHGGVLLEDCSEAWVLEERQPREQAYVAALERLAAAAMARWEPAVAASYLRLAIGADPYREDLQRALMEALAEGGNPAEALLVYRQLRTLLWREMTAEPAEETTALFRRLRDQTRARAQPRCSPRGASVLSPSSLPPVGPAAASIVPRRLPLPLTELIGRQEAVQAVLTRLAAGRLVTLTGAGGVGKTRLALEVASELAQEYEDGAAFVNLAPLADPERVPDAVRAVLELPPADRQAEPLELLRQSLSSRRLLLVLDNCEHLGDACARLADALLGQCEELRILATSRQPLGVHGETVWRVPSLALPPPQTPVVIHPLRGSTQTPELLEYPAVALFVERAQAAEASFEMTARNAAAVVEVCRRLDGIPLAIELAAARVRALPVEQIAARLDDRFRLLTSGRRTDLPRQQTLRASIDWSYELLSAPERCLLQRLSVFAGGWTLEAAEAVCSEWGVRNSEGGVPAGPDPLRPPNSALRTEEVLDLLQSLVEQSLVVYEELGGYRPGGGRYWLLETVRQYASERLLDAREGEAIRARHLGYFLGLAEAAEPHLTGAQRSEWLDRLETEHDNLRVALEWSLSTAEGGQSGALEAAGVKSEAGLWLAAALWRFWDWRGYLTEGRERLEKALGSGPGVVVRGPGRAKALDAAGSLAFAQADYRAARTLYEESLSIRRERGDPEKIADSLNYLATLALAQGEHAEARSLYEESLAIRRQLEDRLGIADSLNCLGSVAWDQGEYAAARYFYEESLAIRRELGDRLGIARELNHLGFVARAHGEYASARALHEESLAIRRELGDRSAIAHSLRHLGTVALAQGDYAAARSLYEEGLAIRRELGVPDRIADSLDDLGTVAREQGEYAEARSLYGESLTIRHQLEDRLGIALSLEALAALACEGPRQRSAGGGVGEGLPELDVGDTAGGGWRAARLCGAAEALREAIGAPVPPGEREAYCRLVSRARALLGEEVFAAAWAEGQAMTLDEAIGVALEGSY